MAPKAEFYFPSLEKCLAGDSALISWSEAFTAISDTSNFFRDSKVFKFLSSDDAIRVLADSLHQKDLPTPQSKTDFETRTAAINIAPASHGQYNIEQIKEDALWLSKEVNLNEVTALRVVVLEWQHRPKSKLRRGFTEAEHATLQAVIGATGTRNLANSGRVLSIINAQEQPDTSSTQFLSTESRRLRILDEYFIERRSVLAVHENLLAIAFERLSNREDDLFGLVLKPNEHALALEALSRMMLQFQKRVDSSSSSRQIESCVRRLQKNVESLASGSGIFKAEGGREDVEDAWTRIHLQEMISVLNIMFLHIRSCRKIFSASVVLEWFRFASQYDFLERFEPTSEAQLALIPALRACVVSVSLGILQLPLSLSLLIDMSGKTRGELEPYHLSVYFLDKSNISDIHDILLTAAANTIPVASPAVFAWGTLLFAIREVGLIAKESRENNQIMRTPELTAPSNPPTVRRNSGSSIGSFQQSVYEEALDAIRHLQPDDPIGFLISSAVERSNVFDIISTAATMSSSRISSTSVEKQLAFQELISAAMEIVGYSPDVVSCLLEILNDSRSRDSPLLTAVPQEFIEDKVLRELVFEESVSRFPFESIPFLKLSAALASVHDGTGVPFVLSRLNNLETFTQATTPDFNAFHTIREDENANLVSLDQPVSMHRLPGQLLLESGSAGRRPTHNAFLIEPGTTGQVVSESKPAVIMWYHRYSGLAFLGKVLDLIKRGENVPFAMSEGSTGPFVAATITLLAKLIAHTTGPESKRDSAVVETAKTILEDSSDSLGRNEDILSLIFEIFEQELHSLRYRPAGDRNLDVLIACVEFFKSVVRVVPGRVWPLLSQSSLLDLDGNGGLLGSVVGSIEASTGYYFFLQVCVDLYLALINEAIATPISNLTSLESSSRSSNKHVISSMAPVHLVGKVLLGVTQALAETLVTATEWRFMIPQQQTELNTSLCTAFSKIIRYSYFVDDSPNLAKKLTAALSACAPSLIEALKPTSSIGTLANPLLRILAGGLHLPDPTIDAAYYLTRVAEVEKCLNFATDAIKAGHSRSEPLVGFETLLNHSLPLLIRLVAQDSHFITPTLQLIKCLLDAGVSSSSTTSLLAQLGSESSQNFLSLLGRYDHPEEDDLSEYCASWKLLSTLVSNHQQWFAVFILTGSSPKTAIKAKDSGKSVVDSEAKGGKSFLDSALKTLHDIETLDPKASIVLLEFVAQAQENWSWATSSIRSQANFLPSLYDYVAKIDLKPNKPVEQSYQMKIATVVAEILTIYFHHMRSMGEKTFLQKAIPCLKWFAENSIAVSGYNNSLHSNLKRNLERKYPACQLTNFKKTSAAVRELGDDYFYDVDIAKSILGHDAQWLGNRDHGFEHEIRRANINLSLVEAQLSLLRSWRTLAIEHTVIFLQSPELQKPVASSANKCLIANTITYPQEVIFDQVYQIRADLALALLQRINMARSGGDDTETLLSNAWDAIRFRETNFETALANNDLEYWRCLVEIIFLTLQLHAQRKDDADLSKPPSLKSNSLSIILEILTVIVAQGFRGMTSVLHDDTIPADTVTAKDFGLILGILQACLRIPALPRITAEISEHLISTDVAKSAVLLFSWAHTLTSSKAPAHDPDPIFGELSILFLVSLSTLPVLAEYLATSSILTQIASTHLFHILSTRPNGVSPFDTKSALSRRLYSIWSTGILPLVLNLLTHVGRNFAAEIASFLNQFPAQLSQAISFSGSISLTTTQELSSLALITFILDAYRAAGPSAGVDALEIPDLDSWNEKGRKELREDVEDLLQRRVTLRKRITPTSGKEAELLRAKPAKKEPNGPENALEERILDELKSLLVILKGGADES